MNNEFIILLVEDNPVDAELTIRALRKHHLANRVIHVTDGQAALDYFFAGERDHRVQPNLVLLDLKLPQVGGIEVLRRLRADDLTKLVPVVVLTSSNEDQDVIATHELGANSYIVKPVEFENFSAAVTNMGLYWMLLSGPRIPEP
jgi:CheY-like chemotaxis protein